VTITKEIDLLEAARGTEVEERRRMRALTVSISLAAFGCGGDGSGIGPPSPGGFGAADVAPECGALDRACLIRGLDSPLAVGARLGVGLTFDIGGTSGLPAVMTTSNPEVMTADDGVITVTGPGFAVLLIRGPDQKVLDFIHLWTAEAEELRLVRYTDDALPSGTIRDAGTLLAGDELLVAVEAFAGNQPLIGLFDTAWTVEVLEPGPDPGVDPVAVVDDVVFGLFRIVARSPGRVRLTAVSLGIEKTLELEVQP
jgi:hypothetical protein